MAAKIFTNPRHPYTAALLDALPERSVGQKRLPTIPGTVPGRFDHIEGCLFHPRCQFVKDKCRTEAPILSISGGSAFRCHFPLENGAALK